MTKTITYKEKTISYNVEGTGNCIILLHGFMGTKKIWNDFISKLKSDFLVIAPDLPGHGESQLVDTISSMELIADIVKQIVEAENVKQFVICGHSMGGYAALQVAKQMPEAVIGLVLFHSSATSDTERQTENRRRMINIVEANREGFILDFIPNLFDKKHVDKYTEQINSAKQEALKMSKEAVIASIAGIRDRKDSLDLLLLAEMPILFIIGKQDARMSYDRLFAQAILPSHSEILLLEDVGHMGYIEAPEVTFKAIKHFALRCCNNFI
ncbi:MAG: alpha/beta hydrolase [Lentimicrobiaceae bacterium]|nr:alpha/beta hydrolase [Lentimicrobiaceae bacterium]